MTEREYVIRKVEAMFEGGIDAMVERSMAKMKEFDGEFIPNTNNMYKVATDGTVWSVYKRKVLKPTVRKDGYVVLALKMDNGKKQWKYLHRIVSTVFIDNPYGKQTVNHKDGNKENNCVDNLEWATRKENSQHAWDTGLNRTTEKKRMASVENGRKLAKPVYAVAENGERFLFKSQTEAAEYIGIRPNNISDCIRGKQKTAGGFKWLEVE